jgi:hypothetical protein
VEIGRAIIQKKAAAQSEVVVGKGPRKIAPTTKVAIEASEMSLAGLARAFDSISDGEVRVPVSLWDKKVTISLTAPFEEVLGEMGLNLGPRRRRSEGKPSTRQKPRSQ